MNTKTISLRTRSFRNKLIYSGCIVILILPMFWLGQPATIGVDGESSTKGGKLEQLRQESKISELEIGEVNMAGEAIRLGTFGLDGVATLVLWQKAEDFKKKKDWTNLSATLKQLILLVPHFETVWRFQGWNLAYNVSVECDNYKDRYDWVIEGIRYLERGTRYNQKSIRITWDVGWTTAQKISKSDERVQFRQLFRQDDDFNKDRPLEERDSWLVGKEWYLKAVDLHTKQGVDLQTISPTLFFSHAPNAQAYYAENLQTEGHFDMKTLMAWQDFAQEWKEYGQREIPTADSQTVRLYDQEELQQQAEDARQQLEALQPGLYDRLVAAKRAKLTPQELAVVDKKMEEMTADEVNLSSEAKEKIRVSNTEWATELPSDLRNEGLLLAKRIDTSTMQARLIQRSRMIVNYRFWQLTGILEQTPEIMEARKLIYEGNQAYASGDLVVAKNNYERAIQNWASVVAKPEFKEITDEDLFGTELREIIDKYEIILNQRNETLPENFPLKEVIQKTRKTDDAILRQMRIEKPSMQTIQ
ncbi:MAG: hypothetical protein Q4C96_00300 [Planctomycetia bacterium]|nr:hypothetical protein [Planctomycetia bacterium]